MAIRWSHRDLTLAVTSPTAYHQARPKLMSFDFSEKRALHGGASYFTAGTGDLDEFRRRPRKSRRSASAA
jgi:hypothetical protein